MSDSANVSIVRRLYEARGSIDVFRQIISPNAIWDVATGFPHGGVFEGLENILANFFGPLFTDFTEFVAVASEYFESDDHVIALGNHSGLAKNGKRCMSRFVHIWTLKDGQIVRFQQTADTIPIAKSLEA